MLASVIMRIVNRFARVKDPGAYAEKLFRINYLTPLSLQFQEIPRTPTGKTPEGYIIFKNHKLAIVEVKLLRPGQHEELNTITEIHAPLMARIIFPDRRIKMRIEKAKRQLGTIEFNGPRMIFFFFDSSEIDDTAVYDAIFGKHITVMHVGKKLFDGPSGLRDQTQNLFYNSILTAIIGAYFTTAGDCRVWIFENQTSKYSLPAVITDDNRVEVHCIYDGRSIKCVKSRPPH